jgi:hypothetical protein
MNKTNLYKIWCYNTVRLYMLNLDKFSILWGIIRLILLQKSDKQVIKLEDIYLICSAVIPAIGSRYSTSKLQTFTLSYFLGIV